jgi:hypothetical protein
VRLLVLVALLLAAPAWAGGEYARPRRVAYLDRALAALRSLGAGGRRSLEEEVHAGARRRCRADRQTPSITCLIEVAGATCGARPVAARASCHLAADVIVTNLLAEEEMVDEGTRARLVGQGDYRGRLRAALAARHRTLAADLVLAQPAGALPDRIDRFCTDAGELAWQRCAAALLWYLAEQP